MSEAESGTHPVYIGRDLKKDVKLEATQEEISMRRITERLIERGMKQDFHLTPLPSEFTERVTELEQDVDVARSENDLDRILDRLEDVESELAEVTFPEDGVEEEIESQIQGVRDKVRNVRPQLTNDDEGE